MQKRFLIFSLFFVILFACEREDSLFYQEVVVAEDVIVVEEATPDLFLMRHAFNNNQAIDTIGQALSMDNGWYMLSNNFIDPADYSCSSTAGGYSFQIEPGVTPTAGGNGLGFSFTFFLKFDENGAYVPFLGNRTYFVPNDTIGQGLYSDLCSDFSVSIDLMNTERISGTFAGNLSSLRADASGPVSGTCASIDSFLTFSYIEGEFDLPILSCD